MRGYKRSVRIAELIQHAVAGILHDLKHAEIGFTTITGVKLTDDLQTARVFYSVIGSAEDTERTAATLTAITKDIRHQLALRLNLRRTPTLEFVFDETPARADRVFGLLEKIKAEQTHEDNQTEEKDDTDGGATGTP